MSRRSWFVAVAAFLAAFTFSTGLARADEAVGNWSARGPTNGYSYQDRNRVWSNGAGSAATAVHGWVQVQVTAGGNAPGGYIGATARLYKGASLCSTRGPLYNGGPASGFTFGTNNPTDCGGGSYRSQGVTYAWHGTGYFAYGTFTSPNISF